MENKLQSRHYLVLDAARFIAALIVVLYHLKEFVYPQIDLGIGGIFTKAYLAVDLFFLMSGVVIAKSYGQKIINGQMTFKDFLIIRFIRLYPLYIAGTVLGVGYLLFKSMIKGENPDSWVDVVRSFTLNAFFVPDVWNKDGIFVLDPAAWSLSLEWIINIIYAAFAVYFSTRILAGITIVSGLMIVWFGLFYGSLDWGWSAENFAGGALRIMFSFTLGMIIFRLIESKKVNFSHISPTLLLVCITLFMLSPLQSSNVLYDFLCVLVVFPVFVTIACFSQISERMKSAFLLSGQMSYAVYILHTPLILWVAGVWKIIMHGAEPGMMALPSFVFIITGIILASYVATQFFDAPVRKYLKKYIGRN